MKNKTKDNPRSLSSSAKKASLLLGVVSLSAAGCAPPLPAVSVVPLVSLSGHDLQGSVENALRERPESSTSREAFELFQERCVEFDAASCSELGVVYEIGIAVPKNASTAATLYRRACSLGNARGCTNLGVLEASGALGRPDYEAARVLFMSACEAGERRGCASLGRLHRDGRGVVLDLEIASRLLDRACEKGEASACLDLAELITASVHDRTLALYVKSCVAGAKEACDRMTEPRSRRTPGAALAARATLSQDK